MATLTNNTTMPERAADCASMLRVVVLGRSSSGASTLTRALSNDSDRKDVHFSELENDLEDCDAAVLAMNAQGAESEVAEVVAFLRQLRLDRGQQLDTAGLPVHVVLTQCDRIDGANEQQRQILVDERRGKVERQIREFANKSQTFGELDVHVAATAIDESLGKTWGIAELHRDLGASARSYQNRKIASASRLGWIGLWTMIALAGLVAAIAVLLLSRTIFQRPELEIKVENYRAREGQTPAQRLSEPLARKISELTEIQNDAAFSRLPNELQQFVRQRLAELQEYRGYKHRLALLKPPAQARTPEDLDRTEQALKTTLAIQSHYQADWRQTAAGQLHEKWLEDVAALRKEISSAQQTIQDLIQKAVRLSSFVSLETTNSIQSWTAWRKDVGSLLRQGEAELNRFGKRLPGSRSAAGQPAVTYDSVLRFSTVVEAASRWAHWRGILQRLLDIACAFGLCEDSARPAAMHVIEPFSATQASKLLADLHQFYPGWQQWRAEAFPESARAEITQKARQSYDRIIAAGRQAIARQFRTQFSDGRETAERWRAVGQWLVQSGELRDLRELQVAFLRFLHPTYEDPASELSTFLHRDRFEAQLNGIRASVADDVGGRNLSVNGNLTIFVSHNGQTARHAFTKDARVATNEPKTKTYSFSAAGEGRIILHPGDAVWAELPVRDAQNKDLLLTWRDNGMRSALYQFEQLSLTPMLKSADPGSKAQKADGVSLMFDPKDAWPRVPDLLPSLK